MSNLGKNFKSESCDQKVTAFGVRRLGVHSSDTEAPNSEIIREKSEMNQNENNRKKSNERIEKIKQNGC